MLSALLVLSAAFNAPAALHPPHARSFVPRAAPAPQMAVDMNRRAVLGRAGAFAAAGLGVQAASAKSVLGVNGQLDFGPLAGDQPGGEGTGKALGINDDSLGFVLIGVVSLIGFLFTQWQGDQDDEDDFFDAYDSRRTDKDNTNRNRV
jgi:hypothetical protein